MDRLSPLFSRFALSSDLFFSGTLCGAADFDNNKGIGILHVLRKGSVRVVGHAHLGAKTRSENLTINEPSLLFYRQARPHRFEVDDQSGADLVCSHIDFGSGMGIQVLSGLPEFLLVALSSMRGVDKTLELLFDEAFQSRSGRNAAINRLVELFTILLLRHAIDANLVKVGVLAGLADERIAKALMAMHEQPERDWTIESLADSAAMSRARFAAHFREIVNCTPLDYLTDWRISVAQTLLKAGKHPKMVSVAVGYSNDTAFARVFKNRVGVTPTVWLTTSTNSLTRP